MCQPRRSGSGLTGRQPPARPNVSRRVCGRPIDPAAAVWPAQVALGCKRIGWLVRLQGMGHEQDEFAEFYRASRDSCLRAVTAVVGDRELAEEQVAEAFTRAWMSWGKVRRHAAPRAWLDPSALRQALARHGIPALVTVGTFCRSAPGAPAGPDKVVHASNQADGSDAIVINSQAMPPGTRLSIGLFPGHTRMLLIEDSAPLSCSGTSRQPAAHITPSGTPIRGTG